MKQRIGFCCILSPDTFKTKNEFTKYKVNNKLNGIKAFELDKSNNFEKISVRALSNVNNTINMLDYCKKNNLKLYRMTSE